MAETSAAIVNRPAWVDLSSPDPAGSRAFYARLLGWDIEVFSDPQYGGYAMARVGGKDVAGIGPKMAPDAPTAWSIYIGTADGEALAAKVAAAGGTVIMAPFDVGDVGRMAVFQDPSGAFISAWQPKTMAGFVSGASNSFAWAELNARGIERAIPFYAQVFGWSAQTRQVEGQPAYTEFGLDGASFAGGMEMNPMVPPQVPSYWMVYFGVDDVDASFRTALETGAQEMLAPHEFPGGRFAILGDPQGAVFGLLRMAAR